MNDYPRLYLVVVDGGEASLNFMPDPWTVHEIATGGPADMPRFMLDAARWAEQRGLTFDVPQGTTVTAHTVNLVLPLRKAES